MSYESFENVAIWTSIKNFREKLKTIGLYSCRWKQSLEGPTAFVFLSDTVQTSECLDIPCMLVAYFGPISCSNYCGLIEIAGD